MKRQSPFKMCGALLVFCGALLVSGVVPASAQNASKLSTDVKVDIRDYCDPASFNAAIGDGTCDRSILTGFITFDGFVAELTADQSVGAWRFAPSQTSVAANATLHVANLGGETHTFTEVKDFGGGFVDFLNGLSGNPVPAPECARIVDGHLVPQPPSADNIFLGPGATATVLLDHELNAKYQCCIHPWMRLTISPQDTHHTEVR
jgi:hypothetical protein